MMKYYRIDAIILTISILLNIFHTAFTIHHKTLSGGQILEVNQMLCPNSTYNVERSLSRKKRYIIFPNGASIQLYFCNTYPSVISDVYPSSLALTAGSAWELPSDVKFFLEKKMKSKMDNRRYKRYVLEKLQPMFKAVFGEGEACLLRTLCESGQRTSSKKPFLKEFLHTLFTFKDDEEDILTNTDKLYNRAYTSVNSNCKELYPNCPHSFFDFIQYN